MHLLFFSVIAKIKKSGNKVVHDKQHACYFCQKLITNIWRHYEIVHKSEARVQKILSLTGDPDSRMYEIDKLRLLGDYYHNIKVLSQKTGQLVVVRRPNADISHSDFLPCRFCFGFFYRKELWRHCDKCKFRDTEVPAAKSCQKDAALLLTPYVYSTSRLSAEVQQVLSIMSHNDVSLVAKNDTLILSYGELLAHSKPSNQFKHVSMRMRMLARLLMRLRNNTNQPDAELSSFIKPDRFDDIVCAVQQEAKYVASAHSSSARLNKPSVALKLGYALRNCSGLVVNRALRERNVVLERDAEAFIRLYDTEWKVRVSSVALKTMKDDRRKKQDLLPLTSDLVKVRTYLDKSVVEYCEALNEHADTDNYSSLVSITLTSVILFNKRRSGEASRMLIESYHHCKATTSGLNDIQKTLTNVEQQLCSRLKLVEIPGKRNRTVPVLLTTDMVSAIDCLLQKRHKVGVDEANPYVFARCSGLNSVDGHTCVRKVVDSVKLQRPDLVTSTYLRKYIATVSQLLDMKGNEFELLCRHMGHSANVHKDYYRLPSHTLELAKLSKLLLAVENGNLNALCGKNLDELDIEEIPDEKDDSNVDTDMSDVEPDSDADVELETTSSKKVLSNICSGIAKRKTIEQKADSDVDTDVSDVEPDSDADVELETTSSKKVLSNIHRGRAKRKKIQQKANSDVDTDMSDVEPDSNADVELETTSSKKVLSNIHRGIAKRKKIQQKDDRDKDIDEHDVEPTSSRKVVRRQIKKHACVKTPWTREEKQAVYSSLHDYIKDGIVPGKAACMKAITDTSILSRRSWKHVKYAVKNMLASGNRILVGQ